MPTLDWLGRPDAFTLAARVPYRVLQPVSAHGTPADAAHNLLIQGDNLQALKSLLPFYRGRVKCIFIDPPYNTQSAFEHYDDNLQHAQWLTMMLPRLQLLRELLAEDGSIWVTIDDHEGHYLKVLMDEVFGRGNFVANVVWQKKYTIANDAKWLAENHDHIHVFAKSRDSWRPNRLPRTAAMDKRYSNPDQHPRGPWKATPLYAKRLPSEQERHFSYTFKNGVTWRPPAGTTPRFPREELARMDAEDEIWFGRDGKATPSRKTFLEQLVISNPPAPTVWLHADAGHNHEAREESKAINSNEPFGTPKPERLLQRILHIATNQGDVVLDSFLGSGTTAAVAHKMGRRWIGIEMGEHARTHCLPRLQKVIAGEGGGISRAVGWGQPSADGTPWSAAQHGGGFRFLRLGEPIFDAAGHIHPAVRFATLAAFVWQQETGTAYDPQAPATGARAGTPLIGVHYQNMSCSGTSGGPESQISSEESSPASDTPKAAPPRPRAALYLLFNGILGDRRPGSGNVLTRDVLAALLALHAQGPAPEAPLVVYGEACRLGPARLAQARVAFRHIPHDVRAG